MKTKIEIRGEEQHAAKTVYSIVGDAMDVPLVEILSGPGQTGITMDLSEPVSKLIRDADFPFTLERHLDGHFGDSTGSSNVTSIRIKRDMSIEEVIGTLESTGQIDSAIEIIEGFRVESDPDARTILAYAFAQYAKGWLAEKIIAETRWFKKGSVSQDKGGIDGYAGGDPAQIGSITRWNSKKKEIEEDDKKHLLYQWDNDGNLHVAEDSRILEVNKQIADEAGLSATLTRRSAGNLKINREVGRSFRYLWW